jgi:hypothetical protein
MARSNKSQTQNGGRRKSTAKSKSSQAHMTTEHEEIRQWVEERGGYPATVRGTESGDEPGVLRIDYPGYSGEGTLERISWDEFFAKFEEANLAFLYQEETKDGGPSRFSKLIDRNSADAEQTTTRKRGRPRKQQTESAGNANPSGREGAASGQERPSSRREGSDSDRQDQGDVVVEAVYVIRDDGSDDMSALTDQGRDNDTEFGGRDSSMEWGKGAPTARSGE